MMEWIHTGASIVILVAAICWGLSRLFSSSGATTSQVPEEAASLPPQDGIAVIPAVELTQSASDHLSEEAGKQYNAVIVGDEEAPMMQVVALDAMPALSRPKIELTEAHQKYLGSITSFAANMSLSGYMAAKSGTVLQVVFSPEATTALSNGTSALMHSGTAAKAVVMGKDGKIQEIGKIVKGGIPKGPALAMLAWQAAAMITAQKYLADISAQLKVIEKGIADIKAWLSDEQWGKIEGMYRYVSTMAETLRSPFDLKAQDVTHLLAGLESLELQVLQVDAMLSRQLQRALEEGKRLEAAKPGAIIDEVTKEASDIRDVVGRRVVCLQTRAAASIIRVSLGANPEMEKRRLDAACKNFDETVQSLKSFHDDVASQMGSKDFFWGDLGRILTFRKTGEDLKTFKNELSDAGRKLAEEVEGFQAQSQKLSFCIANARVTSDKPVELYLAVDPETNEVKEVRYADRG